MQLKDGITLNVQLSKCARKLRSLRIKKGLTYKEVSVACHISVEDVVSYEMDRKTPSESIKRDLLEFLSK